MAQWKLIELLGVSGATISRMLKSLEKLKLVKRGRWESDARYLIVELTREGRRRVKKVLREIVDSGIAGRIVRSALSPPRAPAACTGAPPASADETTTFLEAILFQWRAGFRCGAMKRWPWVRPPERDSSRWLMDLLRSAAAA